MLFKNNLKIEYTKKCIKLLTEDKQRYILGLHRKYNILYIGEEKNVKTKN